MIEFRYDENGILIAYKDGKRVGPIYTMGDDVTSEKEGNENAGKENSGSPADGHSDKG